MTVSGSYPYTQDMLDSTNSDLGIMNTIITGDEFWVYGTRHFPYNKNPTRPRHTISLKCCLLSTDVIDNPEKFTHAHEGLMSPHASTSFSQKIRSVTFLTEWYINANTGAAKQAYYCVLRAPFTCESASACLQTNERCL